MWTFKPSNFEGFLIYQRRTQKGFFFEIFFWYRKTSGHLRFKSSSALCSLINIRSHKGKQWKRTYKKCHLTNLANPSSSFSIRLWLEARLEALRIKRGENLDWRIYLITLKKSGNAGFLTLSSNANNILWEFSRLMFFAAFNVNSARMCEKRTQKYFGGKRTQHGKKL